MTEQVDLPSGFLEQDIVTFAEDDENANFKSEL